VRLFLYGTLLNPATLAARGGDPTLPLRWSDAVLRGWRRVGLAGTPYPTLRRCIGGAVGGKIVVAGSSALRRLAAYEGPRYRLRRVVVEPRGTAWTWIAPKGTRHSWKQKEPS
jgi:Gamma-glutamyl cyclotransferase, AIG2-like